MQARRVLCDYAAAQEVAALQAAENTNDGDGCTIT
jgi:hypothetical protein